MAKTRRAADAMMFEEDAERVTMLAASGLTQASVGETVYVVEDGKVRALPEHVADLIQAGFKRA